MPVRKHHQLLPSESDRLCLVDKYQQRLSNPKVRHCDPMEALRYLQLWSLSLPAQVSAVSLPRMVFVVT